MPEYLIFSDELNLLQDDTIAPKPAPWSTNPIKIASLNEASLDVSMHPDFEIPLIGDSKAVKVRMARLPPL